MYTARDLFADRRAAMTAVERALAACYESRGYDEISTPILEDFSMFSGSATALDPKRIFKLVDNGEVLVIRPDSTAPIGRIVGTKLGEAPLPLRLWYNQEVLRAGGSQTELSQCGIELIGAEGIRAEIELVDTAAGALSAAGLSDFKIELGHAGIFRNLIKDLPLSAEDAERLRRAVEAKNSAEVNEVLGSVKGFERETEALRRLPMLFGGAEIFAEAEQLIKQPAAAEAVAFLKAVCTALGYLGCGDRIIADLGLVNNMNYYTGMILGGYASGTGERVLSGGRYGGLLGQYGKNLSATGFAVNIDAVCDALEKNGAATPAAVPDIMIWYGARGLQEAYETAAELRNGGKRVEMSTLGSLDETVKRAWDKGIPLVLAVGGETRYIETGRGTKI